jgi:hypothetical protein
MESHGNIVEIKYWVRTIIAYKYVWLLIAPRFHTDDQIVVLNTDYKCRLISDYECSFE